jgi:Zinc carboxypeptidase
MRQYQFWVVIALALANLTVFIGLGMVVMNWDEAGASLQIVTATPNLALAPTQPPVTRQTLVEQVPAVQVSTVVVNTRPPQLTATPSPPFARVRFILGNSVEGRPIIGYAFPSTDPNAAALVLVSGIHGDEMNAWPILESLVADYYNHVRTQPANLSVYFIQSLNPDGTANEVRLNANGIDLNRNWETADWKTNVEVGSFEFLNGGGGAEPFSEPESRLMRDFLLGLQANHPDGVTVIYTHAAFPPRGMVLPGVHHVNGQDIADSASRELGEQLAEAADYGYSNVWNGNYTVTGDSTTWAVDRGFKALTIELPVRTPLDPQATLTLRDALLMAVDLLGSGG